MAAVAFPVRAPGHLLTPLSGRPAPASPLPARTPHREDTDHTKRRFEEAVEMGHDLPFEVLFWGAQNIYDDLLNTVYPG